MNDFNRGALPVPCLRLDYGFGEEWASVELGDGTGYVRLADYEKLESENAKLRDAMYTNAGKHALQHMDEDELRIWATQQSEYIEELKELVRAFDWCTENFDLPNKCDSCPLEQSDKLTPECEVRMRKLGIKEDE